MLKYIALVLAGSAAAGCGPSDPSSVGTDRAARAPLDHPSLTLSAVDAEQKEMSCEIRIEVENRGDKRSEEFTLKAMAMSTEDRISGDHEVAVGSLGPAMSTTAAILFEGVVCLEVAFIKVEGEAPLFINPRDSTSQQILRLTDRSE